MPCHVVLYRCLARSHHVTSYLAMSCLRLEFVTRLRCATQLNRCPWREKRPQLSTPVSCRGTLPQHTCARHLCVLFLLWQKQASQIEHCEEHHNVNSSHQIDFASISRSTRTRPRATHDYMSQPSPLTLLRGQRRQRPPLCCLRRFSALRELFAL